MNVRLVHVLLLLAALCVSVSNAVVIVPGAGAPRRCVAAQSVIRNMVTAALIQDPKLAAGLLRAFFHDCAVNGCDASVLLDSPDKGTERYSLPNLSLQPGVFTLMDSIKAELDRRCSGPVVSCADILYIATRDAVVFAGGPSWDIDFGRKDGNTSTIAAGLAGWLPAPVVTVDQGIPAAPPVPAFRNLQESFDNLGLDLRDLVALSGGHTLGVGHCGGFADRVATNTTVAIDPSLKTFLDQACKNNPPNQLDALSGAAVDLDIGQPTGLLPPHGGLKFDNSYFKNMIAGFSVFTSDRALFEFAGTKTFVQSYARSQSTFFNDFVRSMKKMSGITPDKLVQKPTGPTVPVYPGNVYGIRVGKCS